MHILCFYQYYNTPDTPGNIRLFSLLEAVGKEHSVQVITTPYFLHKKKTNLFPLAPEGVDIVWLPISFDNAMGKWQRIRSYGGFAWKALFAGLRTRKKPDVIWGISTPLTVGLISFILARFYRVPWVLEVRDLWPDFPIQMKGFRSRPVIAFFKWMEKWLYHAATTVVTSSPDMEHHVVGLLNREEHKKVQTVIHGTNPQMSDAITAEQVEAFRIRHEIPAKFLVLYGGKFGRANDTPTILKAIRLMQEDMDVHFILCGFGFYEPEVKKAAVLSSNMTYIPELAHHEMMVLNKIVHLSLVTFLDLPVLSANSPAKFFDSLAAGVPVIVTNPGWTKEVVEREACGWYIPPERPDLLAQKIKMLAADRLVVAKAGEKGAELAREHYDRQKLGVDMKHILELALEKGLP
ncbi:MAG: glycosyltransferase family 4 protein [Bacteroidetes Order II. Incertae sedis bacterium]|nr:glycosyltransferase family 4 protein [Bacteroidetes Order II. bacterium]